MSNKTPIILKKGENCWKVGRAGRATPLVDAEEYYAALHAAAQKARHSIHIAGWDIHSQVELVRGENQVKGVPSRLGPFLDWLARTRPELDIRLLLWDFSVVFSMEREPMPVYSLGWRSHRRIKLRLDGENPLGGAHHQKFVVIDGNVAFAGASILPRAMGHLMP